MPAGRQLPAVTKNRNYPQPVKHLKPAALRSPGGPGKSQWEAVSDSSDTLLWSPAWWRDEDGYVTRLGCDVGLAKGFVLSGNVLGTVRP